ncbi:MAG: hypothetical protein KJ587_20235 [Alphaproteobacteria bacterium]|nr:hypothetical protein [Alphaproteobacteria bacterium]
MEAALTFCIKALKEHPEKLLLLACLIVIPILYKLGINQWLSCLAPFGMYITFSVVQVSNNMHHVRMGEVEVSRLEAEARSINRKRRSKRK